MTWPTHEVSNQSPELGDYNLFDADPALQEGARREGAAWAIETLRDTGATAEQVEAVLALGPTRIDVVPALQHKQGAEPVRIPIPVAGIA